MGDCSIISIYVIEGAGQGCVLQGLAIGLKKANGIVVRRKPSDIGVDITRSCRVTETDSHCSIIRLYCDGLGGSNKNAILRLLSRCITRSSWIRERRWAVSSESWRHDGFLRLKFLGEMIFDFLDFVAEVGVVPELK